MCCKSKRKSSVVRRTDSCSREKTIISSSENSCVSSSSDVSSSYAYAVRQSGQVVFLLAFSHLVKHDSWNVWPQGRMSRCLAFILHIQIEQSSSSAFAKWRPQHHWLSSWIRKVGLAWHTLSVFPIECPHTSGASFKSSFFVYRVYLEVSMRRCAVMLLFVFKFFEWKFWLHIINEVSSHVVDCQYFVCSGVGMYRVYV